MGASQLLAGLRWGGEDCASDPTYPRPLHFVSSSPCQLRKVLESKLSLDGLDWSSDTFKDQVYNIRKGRFRLLKHQIPYKVAAILSIFARERDHNQYLLIGDDAESDPYIYLGLKLLSEELLTIKGFCSYLEFAGVESAQTQSILDALPRIPKVSVAGIFIRKLKNYKFITHEPLTSSVQGFTTYLEVALNLFMGRFISVATMKNILLELHNECQVACHEIIAQLYSFKAVHKHLDESVEDLLTVFHGPQVVDVPVKHRDLEKVLDGVSTLEEQEILQQAKIWFSKICGSS